MNYKTFLPPFVNKIQQMTQQETQIYTATQSKPLLEVSRKFAKKTFSAKCILLTTSFFESPINTGFQKSKKKKAAFFLSIFNQIQSKTQKNGKNMQIFCKKSSKFTFLSTSIKFNK
jgi:hypothetical protein